MGNTFPPLEDELARLDEQGFVIIENALTRSELDGLLAALAPYEAKQPRGRNDFEGTATQRVYSLAGKGPAFRALNTSLTGSTDSLGGGGSSQLTNGAGTPITGFSAQPITSSQPGIQLAANWMTRLYLVCQLILTPGPGTPPSITDIPGPPPITSSCKKR